jgi:hypothetical protein
MRQLLYRLPENGVLCGFERRRRAAAENAMIVDTTFERDVTIIPVSCRPGINLRHCI